MKIYAVSQGERSEGSTVRRVFDSIEMARAYAHELRVEISGDVTWRVVDWKQVCPDYWVDGCDTVSIREHEVIT